MVDFAKLMSPAARARVEATKVEIKRLHGLPDRWLAEELLRLARETRRRYPDKLGDPHGVTYDPNFVWHLVPEIAKRLGATGIEPNEARRYAGLADQELRQAAGVYLQNTAIDRWHKWDEDKPHPEDLLCHCVENGNPVAFAMDRICPARDKGLDVNSDRDDLLARRIREISSRRGHPETAHWSPALQEIKREQEILLDEDSVDAAPTP